MTPRRGRTLTSLRLLAALGGTLWTAATVGGARAPEEALHRWSRRLLKHLGVTADLTGPIPEGAPLWVSNHLSWLDPVVFLALRPSGALAKLEVAGYPLVGAGARLAGLRFVDRDNPFSRATALRALARDLGRGRSFLLFPEGTTTSGQGLAPLREGGLRMAYRLGIPVLPFRLDSPDRHYPWTGDATLMPHLRALAEAGATHVAVTPGPRLHPQDYPDADAFVAALRSHLQGS
ncbi:lysophospholipid acyltransferase family protein [Mesoterricola sediminis]|uniref:1-acyl-sn-glycerol-3-phosphate acyltransferase n=1 Tax=Mesoterricola sediminis TaxID=2927980 RepID=A0AA48GPN0_9BACT|nr:lysophospholipid acyltransferase family protein [Mesoterricola sediminis]BDU76946.1 1-acyl-sn-glycerol-3-phosphate acyltransferase [Mesoterricola sediminis]